MGKIPYCGKETKRMTTYFRWGPERIEEVRRMAASGMTSERIGEALGVKPLSVAMALTRARQHNMVKKDLTEHAETATA